MNNNPDEKKVRTGFIYSLLAVAVLAAGYYAVSALGLFNPKERTITAAMSAYRLYTQDEKKKQVILFFGDGAGEGYRPARTEIYLSKQPVNQVKQALLLLTAGPEGTAYRQLLPEGTALKEAYLDPNGILYADFSPEVSANCKGGTTSEYYAVYSVVDTVMLNFPFVKGVRILVDGAEKQSLAGHVMLESILRPDMEAGDIKI